MVRKLALLLIVFAALASAGTVVLTFDDLIGQGPMPSPYMGVNFPGGWWYYDWPQDPYTPHSGNTRIYDFDAVPMVTFVVPEVFDGAWFAGYDTAQLELYYGGSLVHTTDIIGLSGTPQFLAAGYAGLIDEIHFLVNPGFFVMDDFTYEGGLGSPEPASLVLAAAGVLFFAIRRRRAH